MDQLGPEQQQHAVRQHQRAGCSIAARLSCEPESERSLRFASSRTAAHGSLPATIVDLSPGGVSILVDLFLPRGSMLVIEVPPISGSRTARFTGQVRNVSMLDRTPRYKVGLRLLGEERSRQAMIAGLLDAARAAGSSGEGGDARA